MLKCVSWGGVFPVRRALLWLCVVYPLEGANALVNNWSPCPTETDQEVCWDFLLSDESQEMEENDRGKTEDTDKDCLVFEFSSEPLLPCYHVQVSLTQG